MSNATAELLSQLIQNECVNDGTQNSGLESRSADTLSTFFNEQSIEVERHSEIENRDNLVVRIAGKDKTAPKLLLLGHIDVVPATKDDWEFDPFGGEIKDGFVHGRGAVDMLNLTSSMAIAFSNIVKSGFQPNGDVIFAAVADEEAGGTYGADFLLKNYPDLVSADYVLTESGGIQMPAHGRLQLPVVVGEKGVHWTNLEVEGMPSHGSKPYGSDNALVSAAQIIERIKSYSPSPNFVDGWVSFVAALGLDDKVSNDLCHENTHNQALTQIDSELASVLHACCHHTFSPNTMKAGSKINTVADHATIGVDIRSLPGTKKVEVEAMINEALGDLADQVTISYLQNEESSISPTDTQLWKILNDVSNDILGDADLIPTLAPYGTDARFFRREGSIAYGFGLFSPEISYQHHLSMFHGRNEKVDITSLDYSTRMFEGTIKSM